MMYEIRAARANDAVEIARLNLAFNGVTDSPEAYAARLADPRRVDHPILALLDERAVGQANLRLAPNVFYAEPYAELSELFVEEAHRRQGIARALIQAAERLAVESGARQMVILTDFYNHPAQQLYRALGFQHHDIALVKEI